MRTAVKAHDNVSVGGILESPLWAVSQLMGDANMCRADFRHDADL